MSAESLNCPMCGAAASSEASRCEHCGARLATVACPACFGMMFLGAKFCSHCGARAARAEVPASVRQLCPRCRVGMDAVTVGKTPLRECPRCEGIWADTTALEQICTNREQQAAVLGVASTLPETQVVDFENNIRYVPCPVCNKLMNRVNFARCSNVVVDVCRQHGTWFDREELRRIVEFIRTGGLDKARERELTELEKRRQQLRSETIADAWQTRATPRGSNYLDWEDGISAAGGLLNLLLR
jgi:Zn-finger nucleic acid-binding protein